MIEIYVDTNEKLEFRIYSAGERVTSSQLDQNPSVTLTDHDTNEVLVSGEFAALETENNPNDLFTYIVPLEHLHNPRTIRADWAYQISGSDAEHTDFIEVVVPYATVDEVLNAYPEFKTGGSKEKTFDEIKEIERQVRHIINGYCNQSFDYELDKTKIAYGNRSRYLQLKRRLYNLQEVKFDDTVLYNASGTETVEQDPEDYWVIQRKRSDPDIKRGIFVEDENPNFFKQGRAYEITGDWGWPYVPNAVNKAALILIGHYFCPDSNYFANYVDNIRSADWRIEYVNVAETTGNRYADNMLNKYKHHRMAII